MFVVRLTTDLVSWARPSDLSFPTSKPFHGDDDLVAFRADEEGVPFLALQVEDETGRLGFQHLLGGLVEGAAALALLVDRVFEIAGLRVADVPARGADEDAADVAGVRSLVVLVIHPDVELLRGLADEVETHRDLEIAAPLGEAEGVDPAWSLMSMVLPMRTPSFTSLSLL